MTRRFASTAALIVGTLTVLVAILLGVAGRTVYARSAFADRTAAALRDDGVRAFVADKVTDGIIGRKPDLIAVRPFVLAAAHGLVGTRPFEELVRRAAGRAHDVVFSEGAERVVVALPDVGLLVRTVLDQANPALAEKVPPKLEESLVSLGEGRASRTVLAALRVGSRLFLQATILLGIGLLLLALSAWLAEDRPRGIARAGGGLALAGLVLVAAVPVIRLVLGATIDDGLTAGAAQGLMAAYLGPTRTWGIAFLGLGLITAAGGAAFLDRLEPTALVTRLGRWLMTPPAGTWSRAGWGIGLVAGGAAVALNPGAIAAAVAAVAGVLLAYGGLRELFRLLAAWSASVPAVESAAAKRGWPVSRLATLVVAVAVAVAWLVVRNPFAPHRGPAAAARVIACNGSAALCDRRVDEVSFAAAHNAMSNQDVADWMFPHHQAGIPRMLRDGVRAFAIDVHYGFPGGARIKTDLEGKSAAKLSGAVGEEATAIAERIRNTLVGTDEGRRGLYFCHGFCELGAYEVGPVLSQVRDFLVEHPDEVIILVIEDYVTPADLAAAFDAAELTELAYQGPAGPWPTLRTLIEENQRVIVFQESGTPGVPWLHPTEGAIQETPYTFHAPEEFSCRPNRGGTEGSLFLMNHWIETTPAPRPSNAELVNAREVLLARAERCQRERRHRVNLVMVDFYRSGDLLGVVEALNSEP